MGAVSSEIQQAFADTVLPGSATWPKASDVLSFPISYLEGFEVSQNAADLEIWNKLAAADSETRFEICAELEKLQPGAFQMMLTRVFAAYYANPKVLSLVESQHSYPARPPMPLGQVFITTQVAPVLPSATTPLWRKDGTTTAEKIYKLQEMQPNKVWTLEEIMTWHS